MKGSDLHHGPEAASNRRSLKPVLAWGLCLFSLTLSIGGAVIYFLNEGIEASEDLGVLNAVDGVVGITFPIVGALVASRRPENAIGWLFLGAAVGLAIGFFGNQYGIYGYVADPGSLPLSEPVLWLQTWTWLPSFFVIPSLVLLLFPTGRPPSRRWRPFVYAISGLIALATLLVAFTPVKPLGGVDVENPYALEALRGLFKVIEAPFGVAAVTFTLASMLSLVFRYRNAKSDERHQLKWFLIAAALVVVSFPDPGPDWFAETIELIAFAGIPVSAAIAILKYRLYDIDVVINKTIVFGVLAAFITAVYVAIVVGIGSALGQSDDPNLALSITATAVVAIAFGPVRQRVERVANRLVYGHRASPYEVLADTSHALAGVIAPEEILSQIARGAAQGTGAASVTATMVLSSGDRITEVFPEDARPHEPDVVLDITHEDETLGTLALAKAAGEPLTQRERKLLDDLCAHAGVALHNSALAQELAAHLARIEAQAKDLEASRRRIVSARDDSRRRLGGDIAAGPAKSLDDMRARLESTRAAMAQDPHRAAALLDELATEANHTLDGLRELARGVFPPLLADKGIVAALEAHIRKHDLDVTLEVHDDLRDARFDTSIETTVYFCCIEVLRGATGRLVVSTEEEALRLEWEGPLDDEGKRGIGDRIEAMGGRVTVGASNLGAVLPMDEVQPVAAAQASSS